MTYFDTSFAPDAIEEVQSTPVLPEERHIFELIGFERSAPDKYHAGGGVKWSFLVYNEDGSPFIFDDEHYVFIRTTGLTRAGKPNFNIGTYANTWASALLGRELGVDADFAISELHMKRMSAMVIWEPQREDPKKKSIKLASFRHVPVAMAGTNGTAPKPAATQVSADPADDEIDRALAVTKIEKSLARLIKLDAEAGERARIAVDKFDLDTAPMEALTALSGRISKSIAKVLDD